jgi:hypothetical protein
MTMDDALDDRQADPIIDDIIDELFSIGRISGLVYRQGSVQRTVAVYPVSS